MTQQVEEINRVFNPDGTKIPFDTLIEFIIDSKMGAMMYAEVQPHLQEYSKAISKTDPEGLTEKETDEIYNSICLNHRDDIIAIKKNVVMSVVDLMKNMDPKVVDYAFTLSLQELIDTPMIINTIADYIQDKLNTEIPQRISTWW